MNDHEISSDHALCSESVVLIDRSITAVRRPYLAVRSLRTSGSIKSPPGSWESETKFAGRRAHILALFGEMYIMQPYAIVAHKGSLV